MIITLMNSLGVVLALVLLFAFVWGAWRHTVEQTLVLSQHCYVGPQSPYDEFIH